MNTVYDYSATVYLSIRINIRLHDVLNPDTIAPVTRSVIAKLTNLTKIVFIIHKIIPYDRPELKLPPYFSKSRIRVLIEIYPPIFVKSRTRHVPPFGPECGGWDFELWSLNCTTNEHL